MPQNRPFPALLGALAVGASLLAVPFAAAQVRVASWNIARLGGDLGALEEVLLAMALDDKPGFAVAPAFLDFQEVTSSNRVIVEGIVAAAIPTVTYTRATFTSSGSEDGSGGAQLLLYRADLFTEIASGHVDIFTGAGRRADRWQMQLLGSTDDLGVIWIYSTHLKASTGSSNQALRLEGAIAIREDAATLPSGSNVIYLGDFNVYSNTEPAYQKMIESGTNRGIDPLGMGTWSGPKHAIKHTQSPRLNGGDLVGGGMDDRFDLQFSSPALNDGEGFSLLAGSYRSFGNDGNHWNDSINDGNNAYYPTDVPRSNALADDLFDASDHIPVLSDFQIPGVLSCIFPNDLGRVVSGGTASISLLITNARAVIEADAAAPLAYSYSTDGLLTGSGSGVAPLLPAFDSAQLRLAEGLEGEFTSTVSIEATSPGVSSPSYAILAMGTAVRPSSPSFSGTEEVDHSTVSSATLPDQGIHIFTVEVFNHGWDSLQAALDLDGASGLSGRFFVIDGLDSGITLTPAEVRFGFLSDGAADGVHTATALLNTSDEDIPGETTDSLTLTIEVTVGENGQPADFNNDGIVDGADLGLLLASWGPCPKGCAVDLTGDGQVDGADLGLLLAAWGK